MKTILLTLAVLTSVNVFAAPTTDTAEAVSEAISLFAGSNPEEVTSDFRGIKASPNDKGVSVTVYLKSGTKMKYGCHRHDVTDPFECHEK